MPIFLNIRTRHEMQSGTNLENDLRADAKKYYQSFVRLTDLLLLDLIVYRNDASNSFIEKFKKDPLDKSLVENYIENYVPEISRFTSRSLNNTDLSPLVEHQNKIIALDKLANKNEPLENLSLEDLNAILTIPNMKDKYAHIISPLIIHLDEIALVKPVTTTNICSKKVCLNTNSMFRNEFIFADEDNNFFPIEEYNFEIKKNPELPFHSETLNTQKILQADINHGLLNMIDREYVWDYDLNNKIESCFKTSKTKMEQLQADINRGLFHMIRNEIYWDYYLNGKIDSYKDMSKTAIDKLQADINRGFFCKIREENRWGHDLKKEIESFKKMSETSDSQRAFTFFKGKFDKTTKTNNTNKLPDEVLNLIITNTMAKR